MRRFLLLTIILLSATLAEAQRTNEAISQQIRSLKAEKSITLTFDEKGNSSKIMATAANFGGRDVSKAGLQAMNFGMAFYYAGSTLQEPPATINLTFWVMTNKPKFAAANTWKVKLASETLDLGDARYAARAGENMEYLNFKIARADLAKIAAGTNVKFTLGNAEFTFEASHIELFRKILAISDTN